MNKAAAIIKIYFKTQFIWRFDLIMNTLLTVTKILFAYVLWGTIFNGRNEVAGFTFGAMLSYYIFQAFFSGLEQSKEVSNDMKEQIRKGTFSKYMALPVNIFGYYAFKTIGSVLIFLGLNLAAGALWIGLFHIQLVVTTDLKLIVGAITLFLGGAYFMLQFHYFLGLFAFRIGDIFILLMIENNIMQFISGAIIPLALLPKEVIGVMKVMPFYYISYLPTMLLLGKNTQELIGGLVVIGIWILAFVPINHWLYESTRLKYDGVGI